MSPRLEKAAFVAARVTAAGFTVLALKQVILATEGAGFLLFAFGFGALALGLWLLWPIALRIATGVLLLLAVVVPFGMVNPFYASDQASARAGRWFVESTMAIGFGTCFLCLGLAYLVSQARLAVVRRSRRP